MYRKVKKKIAKSIVNLDSPAIKKKKLVFDIPECYSEQVESLPKPNISVFSVKSIPSPKNALVKTKFPAVSFAKGLNKYFLSRQKTNVVFFDFRRTKSSSYNFDTAEKSKIVFTACIVNKDSNISLNINQNNKEEITEFATASEYYDFQYLPNITSKTIKFNFGKTKVKKVKLDKDSSTSTLEIKTNLKSSLPIEINFQSGPAQINDIFFKNYTGDESEQENSPENLKYESDFNLPLEYIDSVSYHLSEPEITDHLDKLLPEIYNVNLSDASLFSFKTSDKKNTSSDSSNSKEETLSTVEYEISESQPPQIINFLEEYAEDVTYRLPSENLLDINDTELPGKPKIYDLMNDDNEDIHSMPAPTDILDYFPDVFTQSTEVLDIMNQYREELDELPEPAAVIDIWKNEYFSKPEIAFELTDIKEPIFDIPKLFLVKIRYLHNTSETFLINNLSMQSTLNNDNQFEVFNIPAQSSLELEFNTDGLDNKIIPNLKFTPTSSKAADILEAHIQYLSQPSIEISHEEKRELLSGLFNYQIEGVDFLCNNRKTILADELGLGKTVQTTSAISLLLRQYSIHRILIVCDILDMGSEDLYNETSNDSGWVGQITKRLPNMRYSIVKGNKRERLNIWNEDTPLVIIDGNSLVEDYSNKKFQNEKINSFDCLIVDECQNLSGNNNLHEIFSRMEPKFVWALTSCLSDELTSELTHTFSSEQAENNEFKIIQRKKENVAGSIPTVIREDLWIEFEDLHKAEYEKAVSAGRKELEDFLAVGNLLRFKANVFFLLHQLKQLSNFSVSDGSSSKTKVLMRQISIIANNKRQVLVFSNYDKNGTSQLEELFKQNEINYLKFVSGMAEKEINSVTSKFKNDKSITVLLSNIKSGGARAALPKVPYIIHFDQLWNPSSQWQIDDIVSEQKLNGDNTNINVYNYMSNSKLEVDIIKKLEEKGLLLKNLIDAVPTQSFNNFFNDDEWMEILNIKSPFSKKNENKSSNAEKVDPITLLSQETEEKIFSKITTFFNSIGYRFLKPEEDGEHNNDGDILTCTFNRSAKKLNAKIFIATSKNIKSSAIKEFIHYNSANSEFAKIFVVSMIDLPKSVTDITHEKLIFLDRNKLAHYLDTFGLL